MFRSRQYNDYGKQLRLLLLISVWLASLAGTFFYSDQIGDRFNFHFRHQLMHDSYMEGRKDGLTLNQQFQMNENARLERKYQAEIDSLKLDLETLKKRIKK